MKTNPAIGLLILRLFIGFRLIYGVIDNILSWDKLLEFSEFLAAHSFPLPVVSALLSVYVQFICSALLIVGFKTRLAAIVLVFNFIVAFFAVHIPDHDSIEGMTPALAMLFGCLTLFFTGAGKLSIEKEISQ
ncbi:DoxX family protein [Fulvivirga sp. RKSG066]|uniref:DoxX family protein n=1 Tax=Fulvivirga aurantia TaxID=2529383 RepID=UPI0012BB7ED2|nr:DoxX family protein [Fulvivirga aurantia]MTI23275.1 DoxX family protein [Fulvivirga aurantia]